MFRHVKLTFHCMVPQSGGDVKQTCHRKARIPAGLRICLAEISVPSSAPNAQSQTVPFGTIRQHGAVIFAHTDSSERVRAEKGYPFADNSVTVVPQHHTYRK
jgi:hypothetical protein